MQHVVIVVCVKRMMSENIYTLIEMLDVFSEGKLLDTERFTMFLQHALEGEKFELLNELASLGKSLSNLTRTLQLQEIQSEYIPKLQKEFTHTLKKFSQKLRELVNDADTPFKEKTERFYFADNENGTGKILALASDFSWLKTLEIEMNEAEQQNRKDDVSDLTAY